MLEIVYEYNINLGDIDNRIQVALVKKMTELTEMMYAKVDANLSGKILQTKTGALRRDIHQKVEEQGNTSIVGTVYVAPESAKAAVLEHGGTKSYAIFPKNAKVLFWEELGVKTFRLYVSNHPASKAFGYLREALEEMRSIVPEALHATLDEVWGAN